ncbi:MAG: NUDIX hydrolase, partial [Acetivibrio ethanolgignens]
KEETGIEHIYPAEADMISLDILTTKGHWKNGSYVAPHLHLNLTYLLIGDEKDAIRRKEDENKAVGWILIEEVEKKVTEPEMNLVYQKILDRIPK